MAGHVISKLSMLFIAHPTAQETSGETNSDNLRLMEYHNTDPPQEDALSKTTARLSISAQDKSVISLVREFLADHQTLARRDSAVSITSIDGEPKHFVDFELLNNDACSSSSATSNESKRRRRRRSSVQLGTEPKPKKVHKKKLRRENEPVALVTEGELEKPLVMRQVQGLLMELALGRNLHMKKWLRVNKPQKVPKVVFAFVPGLYESDFTLGTANANGLTKQLEKSPNEKLSFFHNHFEHLLPLTTSGSKDLTYLCSQALINCPSTSKERKRRMEELKQKKIVLYDLLLSPTEMEALGYPIHSQVSQEPPEDSWMETKEFEHDGSRTFAIDCEFCQAGSTMVLTRISIVNFQGEVVYDTYVQPKEEITNYLTKYSGITEEILHGVTTTLEEVQEKILLTVSTTDILIGHSLNSDLRVLKVKHPRVIDTAIIYHHNRGPPAKPSLKWLAQTHLGRKIQQGEQTGAGHSSLEDLLACLDLVKMKLVEGMEFGWVPRETTIFERMSDEKVGKLSAIIDYNISDWGLYLDSQPELSLCKISDDASAAENVVSLLESCSVILVKFKEVERQRDVMDRVDLLERLNGRLQMIYDALPPDSVLMVASEGGDNKEMFRLQKLRRNFQKLDDAEAAAVPAEERWDFDKTNALHQATAEARRAIAFITVKP